MLSSPPTFPLRVTKDFVDEMIEAVVGKDDEVSQTTSTPMETKDEYDLDLDSSRHGLPLLLKSTFTIGTPTNSNSGFKLTNKRSRDAITPGRQLNDPTKTPPSNKKPKTKKGPKIPLDFSKFKGVGNIDVTEDDTTKENMDTSMNCGTMASSAISKWSDILKGSDVKSSPFVAAPQGNTFSFAQIMKDECAKQTKDAGSDSLPPVQEASSTRPKRSTNWSKKLFLATSGPESVDEKAAKKESVVPDKTGAQEGVGNAEKDVPTESTGDDADPGDTKTAPKESSSNDSVMADDEGSLSTSEDGSQPATPVSSEVAPDGPSITRVGSPVPAILTHEERVEKRMKQIEYGKNTDEYKNYTKHVKRADRRKLVHPMTPDAHSKVWSKRQWDGKVREWRRRLHRVDDIIRSGQNPLKMPREGKQPFKGKSKARRGGKNWGNKSRGGRSSRNGWSNSAWDSATGQSKLDENSSCSGSATPASSVDGREENREDSMDVSVDEATV